MIATGQMHICDVCRLLDFDTEKKFCHYCGLCDAWICNDDLGKWPRRMLAAAKRKLEGGYAGRQDYEQFIGGSLESAANNRADA